MNTLQKVEQMENKELSILDTLLRSVDVSNIFGKLNAFALSLEGEQTNYFQNTLFEDLQEIQGSLQSLQEIETSKKHILENQYSSEDLGKEDGKSEDLANEDANPMQEIKGTQNKGTGDKGDNQNELIKRLDRLESKIKGLENRGQN